MELNELIELKEKIEKGKTKLAELKGQRDTYLSQLKKEFGCESIEDAEKKNKELENSIQKLKEHLEEKENELREKYPNLF